MVSQVFNSLLTTDANVLFFSCLCCMAIKLQRVCGLTTSLQRSRSDLMSHQIRGRNLFQPSTAKDFTTKLTRSPQAKNCLTRSGSEKSTLPSFWFHTYPMLITALCSGALQRLREVVCGPNVEETLSLLCSGARVSCSTTDPELHSAISVAESYGQALQTELLRHNEFVGQLCPDEGKLNSQCISKCLFTIQKYTFLS